MEQSLLDVSDVALLKVYRASFVACVYHGHSPLAVNVVLPLIRIWMPVQFPQPTRMNGDEVPSR